MSRPPRQTYRCDVLGELARQLMFVPPMRRREQALRAEQLHDEITPQVEYPFDYLNYRITRFRSEEHGAHVLLGSNILPDLRLLIDRLTRSAPIPMTPADPVTSVEAIADRLKVSTKTVSRWRQSGLRWRWAIDAPTGRKFLAIQERALARYLEAHDELLLRAQRYTRMSQLERRRLIDRARKLARRGGFSLNQTAVLLATECGRGLETVRQVLAAHEHEHPERPLFPDDSGPLSARQQRVIARAARIGIATRTLAQHFNRSPSTIRRVIHQRRAAELRKLDLAHIDLPTFNRSDADEVILRPTTSEKPGATDVEIDRDKHQPSRTTGTLPHELEALREFYHRPRMDGQQVASLLVRMHYLLHKAAQSRDQLDMRDPRVSDMDVIERWFAQASRIRNELVRAHLPVVLAVAQRHWVSLPPTTRTASLLADLLELGNGVLIDAVRAFDPARDQSFETYLNWALMRDFAAHAPDESRAQRRVDGGAILKRLCARAQQRGVSLGS